MKTLVIGMGYVGKALYAAYSQKWPALPRLESRIEPNVRLEEPRLDHLPYRFDDYKWAIVASAITNVAVCEKEKERTYQCNVKGTLRLVEQILSLGMTPVVFSSDYVFDGAAGGYVESSPLNPLNEYGRQKAAIEEALPRLCGKNHLLIRLSKVIGRDPLDKTVVTRIVQQLLHRETVKAARDVQFSPIFIEDVIEGIRLLQEKEARGIYHLCGTENWNRLELSQSIAKKLGVDERLIKSISLDDLGESFSRPKKTDMSCQKFLRETQYQLHSVREAIETLDGNYTDHLRKKEAN